MQESYGFYMVAAVLIILCVYFYNILQDEIREERTASNLLHNSRIEVEGSDELCNYLNNLSVDERLEFKKDFIKRINLSPFADYYETQRADRFQEKEFQNFMESKGFKYTRVTLNSIDCSSRDYKPFENYNKIIQSIYEQEELYPDDSLNKLSSGFRFGY